MLSNSTSFSVFARPEGNRCLVTSGYGITIARDSRGFVVAKFQSFLPGGNSSVKQTEIDSLSKTK